MYKHLKVLYNIPDLIQLLILFERHKPKEEQTHLHT